MCLEIPQTTQTATSRFRSLWSRTVAVGAGITALAVIVNGLPALIALYLAVATLSQKKLPLF